MRADARGARAAPPRSAAPFSRRAPFDARASRRAAAQALDVSHNRIGSLAPLAPCRELVTLACDGNLLEDLDGLDFARLGRLTSLSCGRNALGALPDEIGLASKLEALSISGSRVESLPATLPGCKKLKDVRIDGCPIKDNKAKKYVEQGDVKNLLKYLEKSGGGKGGGGKGKGKR